MRFLTNFLRNVAFGVFVGAISMLWLAWALDTGFAEDIKKSYVYLFSAFVALLSATLGLAGVLSSQQIQIDLESDRRARKLLAAKAALPSALSNACAIFEKGIEHSHSFTSKAAKTKTPEHHLKNTQRDLVLSDETVSVFREIIELVDDPVVADRLYGLLREYQVGYSRWRGSTGPLVAFRESDVRDRVVYWAYLYAIASSMFRYARGEDENIEVTVNEAQITSAINTSDHPSVMARDFSEEISFYVRAFGRRFKV